MGNKFGSDKVFTSLVKRLDGACKKILENPQLDDESRSKATNQAALYSMTINTIVRESGGVLPESAMPIVQTVNEFIGVVDLFCSNHDQALVSDHE